MNQEQKNELIRGLEAFQKKLDDTATEIRATNDMHLKISFAYVQQNAEIEKYKSKLCTLENQLKHCFTTHSPLEKELAELKVSYKIMEKKRDDLSMKFRTAEEANLKIYLSHVKQNAEIEQYISKLCTLQDQLEHCIITHSPLAEELAELKVAYENLDKQNNDFTNAANQELDELNNICAIQKQKIEQLEKQQKTKSAENMMLKKKLDKANAKIRKYKTELDNITDNVNYVKYKSTCEEIEEDENGNYKQKRTTERLEVASTSADYMEI